MRVGIVGASGPKWTQSQSEKMIATVKLVFARCSLGDDLTEQKLDWIIDIPLENLNYDKLTLVSGHCPVGKKGYWCYDLDRFIYDVQDMSLTGKGYQYSDEVFDEGGVDTWAEIIADSLGIKKEIYPAVVHQWEDLKCCVGCGVHHDPNLGLEKSLGKCICPCHSNKKWSLQRITLKGYRSRNIQIAEAGLDERFYYCKECSINSNHWKTLDDMLKEHNTLKKYPNLHGVSDDYILFDIEPAKSCSGRGGCGGKGLISFETDSSPFKRVKRCKKCGGDGASSGGTWTKYRADKLGRRTIKIIIP